MMNMTRVSCTAMSNHILARDDYTYGRIDRAEISRLRVCVETDDSAPVDALISTPWTARMNILKSNTRFIFKWISYGLVLVIERFSKATERPEKERRNGVFASFSTLPQSLNSSRPSMHVFRITLNGSVHLFVRFSRNPNQCRGAHVCIRASRDNATASKKMVFKKKRDRHVYKAMKMRRENIIKNCDRTICAIYYTGNLFFILFSKTFFLWGGI